MVFERQHWQTIDTGSSRLFYTSKYNPKPPIPFCRVHGCSCLTHAHRVFVYFVVRGCLVVEQVTKGMDVVKSVESVGSASGKTTSPVVIADCGQLS